MSRVPASCTKCGLRGTPQQLPKSPAALCIPFDTDGGASYAIDPRTRVMGSQSVNTPKKRKTCKTCSAKRAERAESDGSPHHMKARSPLAYRSMNQSFDFEYEGYGPRGSLGGESPPELRRSPEALLTPPHAGGYRRSSTPSPIPFDVSLGLSLNESSLENLVQEELMAKAAASPHSPARASGSRATSVSPLYVMTPEGPVKASHQLSMERTLNRLPDVEVISRRLTGTKLQDSTSANQIEVNFQSLEPGGLNITGREDLSREVISVTDTLTVAPGVTSKTCTSTYECTIPTPQAGLDPIQVLEMIEEESKEVEKMKYLQPPELKGNVEEDYGLKKRLQKMKLNRESVRRLESSVINPPPAADEPQEELQPELMAAIMHTEEQGLTMDSPPANVYNYLFPEIKDDMVIKISSVAPSPLQNIVVPVEVPSTLHTSGLTREMQFAAANTRCSQGALPVDNIYTKSVLKSGASPKVNNTAVQDKKIVKTKDYLLLTDEEPPWGVEDLQPLMTLVGASPSNTVPSQDISDLQSPSIYHNEVENSLEYQLIPEAPRHVSRVQLRGTQKPPWFPGYIIALPDSIKLARSPSEVLPAAWQAVQSDIFGDDSFVVV